MIDVKQPIKASHANFLIAISNLIHLVINADKNVSPKEIAVSNKMVDVEKLPREEFEARMALLKSLDNEEILRDGISRLRKLSAQDQIKCIAWLCIIANSDGFMATEEWQLIYQIYHKELNHDQKEIMEMQRQLNVHISGKAVATFGVKVNA